jgi:hypothetical protein
MSRARVCVYVCVCVFSVKLLSPFISKSCTTRLGLRGAPGIVPVSWWRHHSRRRRGCTGGLSCLAAASLEETRWGTLGVLWCVGGGITHGDAVGYPGGLWRALVGWRWHHSRRRDGVPWRALVGWRWHHSWRRGDCSHVLTVCIQTTSLKGAQEVLWRLL